MKIVGWISTVLPLSCWMLTIRYMYMHVHVRIKVKLHVYMYVFKALTFIATQGLVAMLIHSWKKKINVDCVIISPL